MKKRFICLLTVLACCISLCACAATPTIAPATNAPATEPPVKTIKIPDIERLDVDTAKTLLAGKGLIPKIEYEYSNDYDYDLIIRTYPEIGSEVEEDTPVTLYVCKGPAYYELPDSVGYIRNINGIEGFVWGPEAADGIGTKSFFNPWVENGEMYIRIQLKCVSDYKIEFYEDFGTASINDTFDKTVPIKVIYDNKTVDNNGGLTDFKVKIPLNDLGVQKPTNIYIEFDFLVNGKREDFSAGFDLTW